LLALAAHADIKCGRTVPEPTALPPGVVRIYHGVGVRNAEDPGEEPVYHHRTIWGEFTFRAYRLLVGVTIAHGQPWPIKLEQIARSSLFPGKNRRRNDGARSSCQNPQRLKLLARFLWMRMRLGVGDAFVGEPSIQLA
jgi:hypothetical protein